MVENNIGENTVYYDAKMMPGMNNQNIKNTLVIADNSGIREIDLSQYTEAVYTFGRSKDNSIVIDSDIVSGHHGEIRINKGMFYLMDNNSSNGTYVAFGQCFSKIQPGQYYGGEGKDMLIRLGTTKSIQGIDAVLMMYDYNATSGSWKTYQLHEGKNSIGRAYNCDIVIKNVAVSRIHAGIRYQDGSIYIFDNNSTNGVFVNGVRISKPTKLYDKDIFSILNTVFIVSGDKIFYKVNTEGIALELRNLNKVVSEGQSQKTILDNVSCSIGANEFVAIIGGSGAGKTTLMTAMSGFDTEITGNVFCNGINLQDNFNTLKNIIGFVPQQDIIYENITLKKMLYYTAKMKMPDDTTKDEIVKRIADVLKMVELSEHQDTYIRRLSGGQKKRASIAVELLANPGLFFLDEPTSGLDPGTEQHLMKTLSRLSKEQEKTIIMVTHTTSNLHLCDKVIIMGNGGKLCYCGKPDGIKDFFNTGDIVDVYDQITNDTKKWELRFRQSGINRLGSINNNQSEKVIKKKKVNSMNQLSVLIRRYLTLISNDMGRLAMIFLQPALIGILLAVVAEKGIYDKMYETRSILFAIMSAGIWMGLFNTIQEIYKERVILKREYMANLKLPVYMFSKYIVQAMIALVQATILIAVFMLIKGKPSCTGVILNSALLEMLITLFLTIYASASFGLLISAMSKNGDRAMAIAPFVLIFQLLFSGILFTLNPVTEKVSYLTFSRWSMECLGSTNDLNSLEPAGKEDMDDVLDEIIDICEEEVNNLNNDASEAINGLQDMVEVYSNNIVVFDEYESPDINIREKLEKTRKDKNEPEKMFERNSRRIAGCWLILYCSTYAFAGISIAVLTRLKKEQR